MYVRGRNGWQQVVLFIRRVWQISRGDLRAVFFLGYWEDEKLAS
jgi:hypothetical protein